MHYADELSSARSLISYSTKFKILKEALADTKSHLPLSWLPFQNFVIKKNKNSRYYLHYPTNFAEDIETK